MKTDFKKQALQILSGIMVSIAVMASSFAAVSADPPVPGQIYYGTVTVVSSLAGSGATVIAKVNGTQVGTATTDSDSKYYMMIPDNTATTVATGSTITFFVNGVQATPTATLGSGSLNVNITAATAGSPTSSLSVTSSTLTGATVGTSYSVTVPVTGGTAPYAWVLISGDLPAGLSLSSSGTISGTPTTTTTSSFTLQVTDSASQLASATYTITVSSAGSVPCSVTTSSLSSGTVGSYYSATLSASGGSGTYTWSLFSGSLPPGLTINSSGTISGTPTSATSSTFTVRVVDSSSQYSSATLTLAISSASTTATAPSGSSTSSTASTSTSTGSSTGQSSATPASGTAAFSISDLTTNTTSIQAGNKVNISVRVANNGKAQGSKTLVLKINGEGVAQEEVVLDPGESKVVTFAVTKNSPGTYKAGIDFLSTSFDVQAASTGSSTQEYPLSPTIVGIIFGCGLLLILVLLVVIVRKYRS